MNLPVENYDFPDDWKISPVSEVANFSRGVSWRKAEESSEGKGLLVISIPNIKDGWIDYESKFNHYLSKDVSESKHLNLDDIIFVGSSGSIHNVGRNARVVSLPFGKVAFASFAFKATPKPEAINEEFLYFLVNSDMVPFPEFCKRAADGKFNFQLRDFATRLRVPLPPLPEQKKIAHILSTVQRAIEAQERIIQTTTELFKTMLHQLMTAQIRVSKESQITKNLKKYRNIRDANLLVEPLPVGWENYQFADVCDCVKDFYKPVEDGDTPYIGLEHLAQNFPSLVGCGTESDIKSSKTVFKVGDILFGKLRPYLRKGVRANFNGISSTDILVLRVKKLCESDFLKYLVHSDEFTNHAKLTTSGVQHPRTSWPALKEFCLSLPPLSEQKKIEKILSTIQQKVDNAESKKTRLQDMFRTLLHELITAKIHVSTNI